MTIRLGDTLSKTLQRDGKISVVIDLKHPDGDRRIAQVVDDPDAFYTDCRDMVDNPEPIDYQAEKDWLLEQRATIDTEIIKVDAKILAAPKEVIR